MQFNIPRIPVLSEVLGAVCALSIKAEDRGGTRGKEEVGSVKIFPAET